MAPSRVEGPQRHVHLDMLRGLAALLVVAGHARGFVLTDSPGSAVMGSVEMAFRAMMSLGHEAVIVFFALSGYLVGGRAIAAIRDGRWDPVAYLVARLSRLWMVVLPAIVLTIVLDQAGRAVAGSDGYDGRYFALLSSGPSPAAPADYALSTILANVVFLQTILAPVVGSNGPLWSLANEFWYYILFPALAVAALGRTAAWVRLAALAISIAATILLPGPLLVLGLIWLAGAIAFILGRTPSNCRWMASNLFLATTVAAVLAAMALPLIGLSLGGSTGNDLILGLAMAAMLPALAVRQPSSGPYKTAATALSEVSYSLYATHFPLLAFLWFTSRAPLQSPFGWTAMLLIGALVLIALAVAALHWWLFERHTPTVRRWIESRLGRRLRTEPMRLQ